MFLLCQQFMSKSQSKVGVWVVATGIALVVQTVLAVDVNIDFDKAFNFKAAHTWAWNPDGAGKVMMARTPDDDPEALKKLAEPIIMDAVTAETLRRGLKSASDAPDLLLNYYLLLSTGTSAQTLGQFIPGPAAWGIPPFAPGTQSLEMINQGSLVLDFTVKQEVVWRGVARSNIRIGVDAKRREALLREAVRDLLRRFPPGS